MALRGEIVVECDSPDCQAELIISADRTWNGLEYEIWDQEWKVYDNRRVICEQCTAEGKK